jgi:hypothetical protein
VAAVSEPLLLPVRPGTLSAKDKKSLSDAGVIVIEHERPQELRLIKPHAELDSGDLFVAAMNALTSEAGPSAQNQRETFTKLVAASLNANVKVSSR